MSPLVGSGEASLQNISDGDLFWQGNDFGQGVAGYKGKGIFTPGEWHRLVAAYDEAANPPVVTKFLDGVKQDDWTAFQGLDATRRALLPTAILFADGDQDERRVMWVRSIQIRSGKLSDPQCALLGAPDGNPIPVALTTSTVTGQWDFEFGDLSASIGADLQFLDPAFDLYCEHPTAFGLCSDFQVPPINGVDAKIMRVPGELDRRLGYVMTHRIQPKAGVTTVNQYTLIMDLLVDASGPAAAALLQVDSPENTNAADLFWRGANFGFEADGCQGTGAFTAGQWHRIALAYDGSANPTVVRKSIDGIIQEEWSDNQGQTPSKLALSPTAVLFGDGDEKEKRVIWVKSIQIRPEALGWAQLESLGKPGGNAIPLLLETQSPATNPVLRFTRAGSQLTLSWPSAITGYVLEKATSISAADWREVPGVVGNSAVISLENGNGFFRLRK